MKIKYILPIFLSILTHNLMAATDLANAYYEVCQQEGAVVFILHKDIDGMVITTDAPARKWSVELPYDMLSGGEPYEDAQYAGKSNVLKGISACSTINVKSAENGSSYNGGAIEPGDVNTFAIMTDASTGPKCWCRFTGPITSWWTYVREFNSDNDCNTSCTDYCANGFASNTEMSNGRKVRDAMIDGVW